MSLLSKTSWLILLSGICLSCQGKNTKPSGVIPPQPVANKQVADHPDTNRAKTIHILVALCDNKYQGIVPVPAAIGNGQNAASNLYWGAGYGVKSFFKKSKEWKLLSTQSNPATYILERLLFKHATKDIYLLADAYDGQFILNTTTDLLQSCAGDKEVIVEYNNKQLFFGGASSLIGYIGHDGLMDFNIEQRYFKKNNKKRETIILACYSKKYFTPHLQTTGAIPLVWTTGLMAPEAYTMHDAITKWIDEKPGEEVRNAAAVAYNKYQKCGLKASRNLLVSGW